MEQRRLTLRFPEMEADEASWYARDLADTLEDLGDSNVRAAVSGDNPEAQDFGATVVLILGTSAVAAVAEGIKSWLARNSGARIEMFSDGRIIAKNLQSKDAVEIARAMSKGEISRAASK